MKRFIALKKGTVSDLKTKENDTSVEAFIQSVEHDKKREEAFILLELFEKVTGEKAKMWGNSIIGFGKYHYVYESGREGDWMMTGFSPRKSKHSLYMMSGFEQLEGLMEDLGKFKTGKSCLYINKLEDIDIEVLKKMIEKSCAYIKKKYKVSS